jgi:hypothetical protein
MPASSTSSLYDLYLEQLQQAPGGATAAEIYTQCNREIAERMDRMQTDGSWYVALLSLAAPPPATACRLMAIGTLLVLVLVWVLVCVGVSVCGGWCVWVLVWVGVGVGGCWCVWVLVCVGVGFAACAAAGTADADVPSTSSICVLPLPQTLPPLTRTFTTHRMTGLNYAYCISPFSFHDLAR